MTTMKRLLLAILLTLCPALTFAASSPCIKHTFQSAKTDSADSTIVSSSEWNDCHTVEPGTDLPTPNLGATAATITVANDTTTGTTVNKLAKLTGAPSKAVLLSTADLNGALGIVISGAGTSGDAKIAVVGIASCAFDGATTAGHYVQISSTTAGNCKNAGATFPSTGQVIGRVLSTNASAGTYSMVLFGAGMSGPLPVGGECDGTAGCIALGQGTQPSAMGTNTIQTVAPASVTSYRLVLPGAAASGLRRWTNSSGVVTESIDTAAYITASSTDTLTNKTFDAGATGNVLKMKGYIYLTHPHSCDGTGASINTTATSADYGHATFSNSADESANYCEYLFKVPPDIDTAVDLRASLDLVLGNTDTGTHRYVVSMASVATSSVPGSATLTNAVNLDFAGDASGASGDYQTIAFTTLTSWRTSLTANQLFRIRLARDGNASQDASTVNSTERGLVLEYGIVQ